MPDTTLRSGLIRLAYANPNLRPVLLPLIEQHSLLEGKQASVNPQGAAQAALLAYFKDLPVGTTEELGDVHRHPSFRLMEFGRLMSAAKALAKKGVFKWDGSAVTKIASRLDGSASVKTAGGSGAANAAFLRQSPLKNKILQAVAKHYGTSVKEIEAELTDPDAEALYEYIGNDRALQMQVYREFSTFSKNKHAAAKAPAKLKGKKLDDAISKAYYKHGDRVQVDIMNIGKIYAAGKAAYEGAESLEEADKALDEAMKAAIAKYRMN